MRPFTVDLILSHSTSPLTFLELAGRKRGVVIATYHFDIVMMFASFRVLSCEHLVLI